MKKIDKLILSSFVGPFFLTFLIVVFILLTQHMLNKFDDIVGKDLGWDVLAQLFFHFAVFVTPVAIPLAILLSSLMTFGNLGEHFELTALKSAGISLVRALLPIFVFVLGLTIFAFYSNNYFVPRSALEAYSLLYDIKQKKPALDLKQGAFYNGIPDFSIKVNKRHDDGKTLEDIIIYDHRNQNGNKKVTLADSGAMYTILNDRYLKLELFDGHFFFENNTDGASRKSKRETLSRSSFSRSEYVLDLSSFGLDRTDKSLFEGNRIMRNIRQLVGDVDSMGRQVLNRRLKVFIEIPYSFYFHKRNDTISLPPYLQQYSDWSDSVELTKLKKIEREKEKADSLVKLSKHKLDTLTDGPTFKNAQTTILDLKESTDEKNKRRSRIKKLEEKKKAKSRIVKPKATNQLTKNTDLKVNQQKTASRKEENLLEIAVLQDTIKKDSVKTTAQLVQELMDKEVDKKALQTALSLSRQAKSKLQSANQKIEQHTRDKDVFDIQYHKILANSVACIIMFLIGAPLGAIIKRGGLGIPVLMSIIFFIIFYVISMTGEKYSKQDLVDPAIGMWAANAILLPIGLLFLRQARVDARLFDSDFYNVMIERFKRWFANRKSNQ
ncbi:MAG: LptF/LptG family permease [Bacteroidota bacterium]|mgnify:CR=1 FL=1